jgi:transglutaminase-like putative cysteine protease
MTTTFPTARVRVGCDFSFAVPAPISAVFQVEPQDEPRQRVLEHSLSFVPAGTHTAYQDTFGNRCSRLNIPPGSFEIHYEATLEVPRTPDDTDPDAPEMPIGEVPSEVLLYLLPSAFCLSDVLVNEAWARFGGLAPGWGRVQAIVTAVHEHLLFGYGTSSPTYTAADAFAAGQGVCRDFAHLAITFCRALNIPARYVFGYLPDIDIPVEPVPMDFAAWMEVWLGGRWWTFDPRNNRARTGRVVIGRGRDAVDVAMVTTYGDARLLAMTVQAEEAPGSFGTAQSFVGSSG